MRNSNFSHCLMLSVNLLRVFYSVSLFWVFLFWSSLLFDTQYDTECNSVFYAEHHIVCHAECHHTECQCLLCCESSYWVSMFAMHAECHYTEGHCLSWKVSLGQLSLWWVSSHWVSVFVMMSVIRLDVIRVSVVMVSVIIPSISVFYVDCH